VSAAGLGAAAPVSITSNGVPLDTLLPLLTSTSTTVPAAVDGTSIVALSVSSVMSGVSSRCGRRA
jgi:hypothetical protein